ncbi:MAG: hypothetical protein ACRD8Z_24610 [Nitrososphaeraceae archaeon]
MPRVCACIRAIDRQRSEGRHLNVTDIEEVTGITKKLNNRDSKNEHMNKAHLPVLSILAFLMATAFILPGIQVANAQYTGGGGTTSGSIEEQLKLAREKTGLAETQGAYGSGTSMVAGNIDSTILFIVALVVIFGAVSAAFFIKSRGARRAATTQYTRQSEPDWKLEAQRYKEELEAMKKNQNR